LNKCTSAKRGGENASKKKTFSKGAKGTKERKKRIRTKPLK